MGTARDERDRQGNEQQLIHDTDLMEPSFESGTKMTSQGTIPPVQDGFKAPGPSASERAYGSYVQVTASTLNVRSSPSSDSKANIIGKLPRGAKLEQRGRDGDWVKISFKGQTAFVHGSQVVPINTRASADMGDELMRPESASGAMADDDLMQPDWDSSSGKASSAAMGDELMRPESASGAMDDLMRPDWDSRSGKASSAAMGDELMRPESASRAMDDDLMRPD